MVPKPALVETKAVNSTVNYTAEGLAAPSESNVSRVSNPMYAAASSLRVPD